MNLENQKQQQKLWPFSLSRWIDRSHIFYFAFDFKDVIRANAYTYIYCFQRWAALKDLYSTFLNESHLDRLSELSTNHLGLLISSLRLPLNKQYFHIFHTCWLSMPWAFTPATLPTLFLLILRLSLSIPQYIIESIYKMIRNLRCEILMKDPLTPAINLLF